MSEKKTDDLSQEAGRKEDPSPSDTLFKVSFGERESVARLILIIRKTLVPLLSAVDVLAQRTNALEEVSFAERESLFRSLHVGQEALVSLTGAFKKIAEVMSNLEPAPATKPVVPEERARVFRAPVQERRSGTLPKAETPVAKPASPMSPSRYSLEEALIFLKLIASEHRLPRHRVIIDPASFKRNFELTTGNSITRDGAIYRMQWAMATLRRYFFVDPETVRSGAERKLVEFVRKVRTTFQVDNLDGLRDALEEHNDVRIDAAALDCILEPLTANQ
ncbi:MAG TPA: hypothetical protein VMC43_01680 [Candidatus Paceibacterota bacterium]|nr:hypothetical protein [Candidatus Paceibacterota bacterium]